MLRTGQVPGSWFGEMPDVLAVLRSYQSPTGGTGDGGNGGDGQPAGGSAGGQGGTGDDPAGWDKERAARTIQAQREEARKLKEQLKEADELRAKLKAIEDKDKTDSEKLAGDLKSTSDKLTAAEKRAAELEAKYSAALIGAAIEREAGKANAVDAETVAALVDRSEIKLDEAGNVTGADKAVAALLKAKPFLIATGAAGGTVKPTPGTPGSTGGSTPADLVKANREKLAATGMYGRL